MASGEDGLVKNGHLRTKRIITEIRHSPRFTINSGIWDIAEKFGRNATGFEITKSNGITVVNEKQHTQFTVEIDKTVYSVENVPDAMTVMRETSNLLSYITETYRISKIERLGFRFFYMFLEPEKFDRAYYAGLISHTTGLTSEAGFPSVTTTGLVWRFDEGAWKVRFGVFSADEAVIRKYHRFHSIREFLQTCILFDIDLSQNDVLTSGAKAKEAKPTVLAMGQRMKDAYQQSLTLVRRYLALLKGEKSA